MTPLRRDYVRALRTLGYGVALMAALLVLLGPHWNDLPYGFYLR